MTFRLNLIAGPQVLVDDSPHADLPAARTEALQTARELMADRLRDGQPIWPDAMIEIIDEHGHIADVISLEQAAFGCGLMRRHFRLYAEAHHAYLILTPDLDILEANPVRP